MTVGLEAGCDRTRMPCVADHLLDRVVVVGSEHRNVVDHVIHQLPPAMSVISLSRIIYIIRFVLSSHDFPRELREGGERVRPPLARRRSLARGYRSASPCATYPCPRAWEPSPRRLIAAWIST